MSQRAALAPVVDCAKCDGVGFVLRDCRCVGYGNRLLIEDAAEPYSDREPYLDCVLCGGAGGIVDGCLRCGHTGQRRAQLVLTVANLDTGAVASTTVVAGTVAPRRSSNGGWELHLTPLVGELIAAVDARSCTDLNRPELPAGEVVVYLPRGWRPDLPPHLRREIEAAAIATQPGDPWRVFLGRSAPAPRLDLDAKLAGLCRVANLLCLDLVIEIRHTPSGGVAWDIRYEMPGSDLSAQPRVGADDLPGALATTTVENAMYGLAERGLTAPAHFVRPDLSDPCGPPVEDADVDVDRLERRIIADCTDPRTGGGTSGAQAIWRNRRWWHTSLRPGGGTEYLAEVSTGQIVRHRVATLLRNWEPPPPDWLGEPIPYRACPDCSPRHRLRRCPCTLAYPPADPGCEHCGGAGLSPSALPCSTCRDSRRVYAGTTVTISDLNGRAVHLSWRTGEDRPPAALVATEAQGGSILALPDRYRLASWAGILGVRAEDLAALDGGRIIDRHLRDGIVTVDRQGVDPLDAHIARYSRGQPGGRILIAATVPDVPSLGQTIRLALALGLGLAITITVLDHRLNLGDPRLVQGERWQVEFVAPGRPIVPADPVRHETLESAIAGCLEYAELALAAAVPADPNEPIHVPRCDRSAAVQEPSALIRRFAYEHPGLAVTAHYDRDGFRVHVHDRDGARRVTGTGRSSPAGSP